jgi:hypothetical protein
MGLHSTSKKRARLPCVYISSHRVIISFIFKTTTRYCTFILHVCRKKVEAQVLAPDLMSWIISRITVIFFLFWMKLCTFLLPFCLGLLCVLLCGTRVRVLESYLLPVPPLSSLSLDVLLLLLYCTNTKYCYCTTTAPPGGTVWPGYPVPSTKVHRHHCITHTSSFTQSVSIPPTYCSFSISLWLASTNI